MEAGHLRERRGEPVGASPELTDIDPTALAVRSPWRLFWRRFRDDRLALAALGFVVLLVAVAVFAPVVTALLGAPAPDERDTGALDPVFATPTGPSAEHWFGVDQIGRDVLSRTIYGARVSLIVAFAATALASIAGIVAGLLAGYFRGWVDAVISRSVDVLLAIPYLLLAIGLASACTIGGTDGEGGCLGGAIQPGIGVVIFVIALTSWTFMARIIRGQVLSLREKEFIEAARATGASNRRILVGELLPNLTAPITVYATILIPQVILYEAALSYLGVGVTDQPSWGQMLAGATPVFSDAWWYMLFPGLALLLTVLAFNLVGDAMQDALNPRASRRRRAGTEAFRGPRR
ncbi:MAG TPA: ABC transporter permease [Solirubrobacterales bacterium]|nr:ABC transporter permease [Solirubrobacterales bacterium]